MVMVGKPDDGKGPIEPQGHAAGMPYDWRPPTSERLAARLWNADDPRFFTPKTFGWGYDMNFYWLAHPMRYLRNRRR
jgi:hypothetical protein